MTATLSKETCCLRDAYGRPVDNLRMAITQNCNMSCFFCHREGEATVANEMNLGEIRRIVRTAAGLGIRRLKITGGEPLVHPQILDIVSFASGEMEEVSMTTNGLLLEEYASPLKEAGLDRVNVSLHSLQRERFKRITGIDGLERVVRGIRRARDAGLLPVKLNTVVLDGLNTDEIDELISFAGRMRVFLRLIEFLPLGRARSAARYHANLDGIEADLRKRAIGFKVVSLNHRPQFTIATKEGPVEVELVKPSHNREFCANCTRLRVTSDGKLKPCLMRDDNLVDTRSNADEKSSDGDMVEAFREAVARRKPFWT